MVGWERQTGHSLRAAILAQTAPHYEVSGLYCRITIARMCTFGIARGEKNTSTPNNPYENTETTLLAAARTGFRDLFPAAILRRCVTWHVLVVVYAQARCLGWLCVGRVEELYLINIFSRIRTDGLTRWFLSSALFSWEFFFVRFDISFRFCLFEHFCAVFFFLRRNITSLYI